MPQQQSPFLEGKYGWNFGEGGWNTGMDENLLKFSFMFDRNVDGIVGSLPGAVNGESYFLTTDNRLYFAVGTTWYSSPTPKWFEFKIKSTGDVYQFNGTNAVQVESPAGVDARLDAVELTLSTLGTAAFEDVTFFATQAELDVVEAQAQAYTDDLRTDLSDSNQGASLVAYKQAGAGSVSRTLLDKAREMPSVVDFGSSGDGVTDNNPAFSAANTAGGLTFIPKPSVKYFQSSPINGNATAWLPDPSQTWDQLTDGGKFNFWRGRATSLSTGANIWRFSDRIFVGGAASKFAGNDTAALDGGTSWLSDPATAPSYLGVNAGVLFTSEGADPLFPTRNSPYGFVSAVKSSVAGQSVIGMGVAVVNDKSAETAWAYIAEIQRESGSGNVYGLEIAAKNKGSDGVCTPNTLVSGGPSGVYGVWAAGGGDDAFGGAPANPSTAALAVLNNTHTWNSGVVFARDALTNGEAMALSSEGIGGAHALKWYNAAGTVTLAIQCSSNDTTPWLIDRSNNGFTVQRNSQTLFTVNGSASAVNGLTVFGSNAGTQPQLVAAGTDTNIDLQLTPKGSGNVRFGTFTASADAPVTGYITIKDAGGTLRKLAVIA